MAGMEIESRVEQIGNGDLTLCDNEEYEDFPVDQETPNTCWCWVQDDDGNYSWEKAVINNAVAGDTDSIMLTMKSLFDNDFDDIDLAVDVADAIGSIANDSFPDFCKHAFNCPDVRNDAIKTDREVVSDKSLFLSKKRYIMHMVDSEGTRIDKHKIMGVEIKKSDTSRALKDMLLRVVHFILDDVDEDEVLDKIESMKSWFKKLPPYEIAKPMSVKTLKGCEDSYRITGSMKGFPYQVRAAMYWNAKCGPNDKRIMPGDKVRLLYIRGRESKYIAFPVDMVTMPDWFNEIVVDYDTEWEKANKKIESYLSSVGMDVAGRKAAIRNNLFGF